MKKKRRRKTANLVPILAQTFISASNPLSCQVPALSPNVDDWTSNFIFLDTLNPVVAASEWTVGFFVWLFRGLATGWYLGLLMAKYRRSLIKLPRFIFGAGTILLHRMLVTIFQQDTPDFEIIFHPCLAFLEYLLNFFY